MNGGDSKRRHGVNIQRTRMRQRRLAVRSLIAFLSLVPMLGCQPSVPDARYGQSTAATARNSPGGYSVLRAYCKEAGFQTSSILKLTPSVRKMDVIIWTPDSFNPHQQVTIDWIQEWLAEGGKTLVYVGRDYSAYADLLERSFEKAVGSRNQANLSEKDLSDRELAVAIAMHLEQQKLLRERSAAQSQQEILPWATHDLRSQQWKEPTAIGGEWAEAVQGREHRIIYRSVLRPNIEGDESSEDAFGVAFQSETLLADGGESVNSTSTPLLSRLVPSGNDWLEEYRDSQIFLLSTPALVSNYSLTHEGNRQICKRLVEQFGGTRIGFVAGEEDPVVRFDQDWESQKGFELLTQWPMSLISLHALFMGGIVLLALYPILGRPRKLPVRSSQDFAQHIVALGDLLGRTRDEAYAKKVIGDYFRTVKRDPHSHWSSDSAAANDRP